MNFPVDCEVGLRRWDWSDCSATCGNGSRHRFIEIVQPPKHGGAHCRDEKGQPIPINEIKSIQIDTMQPIHYVEQKEDCQKGKCIQDCEVVAISEWSDCSVTCGEGSRSRILAIVQSSKHGEALCRKEGREHSVTNMKF